MNDTTLKSLNLSYNKDATHGAPSIVGHKKNL